MSLLKNHMSSKNYKCGAPLLGLPKSYIYIYIMCALTSESQIPQHTITIKRTPKIPIEIYPIMALSEKSLLDSAVLIS